MKQWAWQVEDGVSLIELLITMGVLVILLTMGVPELSALIARSTRTTELNTLVGHLHFARLQAIYRAGEIVLCPASSRAPATCTGTPWAAGYAVVDERAGEALRYQKPSIGITIRSTANFARRVRFQDDGSVLGAAGGSFTFCANDDAFEPRRLVVSGMGRVLISEDASCDED